jgi:hypothetical protein
LWVKGSTRRESPRRQAMTIIDWAYFIIAIVGLGLAIRIHWRATK